MSAPKRIQLSRRKGWRKPENTVVVSRPSIWGNPYAVARSGWWDVVRGDWVCSSHATKANAAAEAVRRFEIAMRNGWHGLDSLSARRELAGKNLACWCPLDQPCHVDALLEIANGTSVGDRVDAFAESIGIELMPWQREIAVAALSGEEIAFVRGRRAGMSTVQRIVEGTRNV